MKAQLIVVQGKPEGKTIPLALPQFKIGRGVSCQLKPNDDQVSREHAMFEVTSDSVFVQDLGSRNGTELNGKKLSAHEPARLKNGDLVKVGALTFAVSIEGSVASTAAAPTGPIRKTGSLDDLSHDDIGSWLVSDASKEPPDRASGVYGGETLTMAAFKAKDKPASTPAMPVVKDKPASTPAMPVVKTPATAPAAKATVPVIVPEPEAEAETEQEAGEEEIEQYQEDDGIDDLSEKVAAEIPEEFVDESNPFYVKKAQAAPAASKEAQKDSSDAAHDILRRMMDRRKASKSQ